jgi:hypothetical protein
VVPELGGPGGPLAPPIFGRSVNPIETGCGQIMPTITTGPPKVFHLPASLLCTKILGTVKFFLKLKNFLKSNVLKSKIHCIIFKNKMQIIKFL